MTQTDNYYSSVPSENSKRDSAIQEENKGARFASLEFLLILSIILICLGLALPSVYKPGILGGTEYNLFGAVQVLLEGGNITLGILVFVFSFIFPIAKNITALLIARQVFTPSLKGLYFLEFLGKWSMMDVFLVAFLIGFTQLVAILSVEARVGCYLFAIGVLLNNIATSLLAYRIKIHLR